MYNLTSETKKWVDDTWTKIDNKLSKVALRSRNKLPYTASNGVHNDMNGEYVGWWTNGFWGGLMWLMYSETKNDEYKTTALNSEKMLNRITENFKMIDHDIGFIWHLTSGANYRLTGDEKAFNKNLLMASVLSSRYNIDGKYIRAWNHKSADGISIIDCMMNLSILYWASEVIGDDRYTRIAKSHADMVLKQHIRADGSTYHQVRHNPDTGDVTEVIAGQGYDAESCWSRGLAWAVYGMYISYAHTGEKRYFDAAVKCADYFIENAAKTDYFPLVDFCAPREPAYYDSTAGACTACALLEISKQLEGEKKKHYVDSALKLLRAIDEKCCNYDENIDFLVGMGTERYPLKEEFFKGVHIPIVYGDFFFVEAILKLKENNFFIW